MEEDQVREAQIHKMIEVFGIECFYIGSQCELGAEPPEYCKAEIQKQARVIAGDILGMYQD